VLNDIMREVDTDKVWLISLSFWRSNFSETSLSNGAV
jgi:hypothetical protein